MGKSPGPYPKAVPTVATVTRPRFDRAQIARLRPRALERAPLRVGLFVGLFCQAASGFWRFVAVAGLAIKSAESPATTGNSRKSPDAGGGTRTPDTRIMIPLL